MARSYAGIKEKILDDRHESLRSAKLKFPRQHFRGGLPHWDLSSSTEVTKHSQGAGNLASLGAKKPFPLSDTLCWRLTLATYSPYNGVMSQ